jgi:hypothetical protein
MTCDQQVNFIDFLFDQKKGEPYQINLNAQGLQNNLQTFTTRDENLQVNLSCRNKKVGEIQEQVGTLRTDLMIPGPTISP